MDGLRLYLLGPFQAILADQPVRGFAYDKVRALLAYLVTEPHHPHSRDALAALLWPEAGSKTARTNLRKALSTLRKAICDQNSAHPHLIIERDTVQFDPDSNCWLDVDELKKRLDASLDHAHVQLESCETCVRDLEEAAILYRGDFLQGLMVDSLEFEEWSLTIRENLHTRMLSALHELTQYYLRQGEYRQAQKYALRQVELEPYREEAHRALMRGLSRSGQRSAALAQYERCRRVLRDELGVEPSVETEKLYERIRSSGEARPHNLPSQQQRLVGRETELHEIGIHLANPDCRLLTLVGMGGIGKTSLALRAARENLGAFLHGVFWVSLASLRYPDQVVIAILDALAVPLGNDPETQLLDYLRAKSVLLVLDNFEHLLSTVHDKKDAVLDLLNMIMRQAPHVKLLVTSRQRLRLRAEWLFQVEGLPYPADLTAAEIDSLSDYAAVQLFVRRARQVVSGFPANADDYRQIARICQLLHGIPLGIELASGWADQLECQQIADGIETDLEFLVTSLRDTPDRHQSLRAVFSHSWKLLSPDEQVVLRRLSVFQATFNQTTARQITDAAPYQLEALANKSFLRVEAVGCYSLHLLLKQFLIAELAAYPAEEGQIRQAHATYYANFLREREYALTAQFLVAPLDEVGAELADVCAAWDWAIAQKDADIISSALEGLFIFYWARNRFTEGQHMMKQALQFVETLSESPQKQLLWARLQCRIADFIYWVGDLKEAEELSLQGLDVLESLEATNELAFALELLARVVFWQGDYERAREIYAQAIDMARTAGAQHILAQALGGLATVICDESGDFEASNRLYAESLEIYQQLDNVNGIAKTRINQGAIAYEQGDFAQARELYRESLKRYREVNYSYGVSACLNNLAIVARKLGEFDSASALIEESLALKRETGNQVAILHSLLEIGALNTEMGNHVVAHSHFCRALQMALDAQAVGMIYNIVLGFAELYGETGGEVEAVELAAWVLAQENVGQEALAQADTICSQLENRIAATDFLQSRQQALELDLDEIVTALLKD